MAKLVLDKLATVATKNDFEQVKKELKNDISVLDSKIDILNNHLLEHETDIQLLKKSIETTEKTQP